MPTIPFERPLISEDVPLAPSGIQTAGIEGAAIAGFGEAAKNTGLNIYDKIMKEEHENAAFTAKMDFIRQSDEMKFELSQNVNPQGYRDGYLYKNGQPVKNPDGKMRRHDQEYADWAKKQSQGLYRAMPGNYAQRRLKEDLEPIMIGENIKMRDDAFAYMSENSSRSAQIIMTTAINDQSISPHQGKLELNLRMFKLRLAEMRGLDPKMRADLYNWAKKEIGKNHFRGVINVSENPTTDADERIAMLDRALSFIRGKDEYSKKMRENGDLPIADTMDPSDRTAAEAALIEALDKANDTKFTSLADQHADYLNDSRQGIINPVVRANLFEGWRYLREAKRLKGGDYDYLQRVAEIITSEKLGRIISNGYFTKTPNEQRLIKTAFIQEIDDDFKKSAPAQYKQIGSRFRGALVEVLDSMIKKSEEAFESDPGKAAADIDTATKMLEQQVIVDSANAAPFGTPEAEKQRKFLTALIDRSDEIVSKRYKDQGGAEIPFNKYPISKKAVGIFLEQLKTISTVRDPEQKANLLWNMRIGMRDKFPKFIEHAIAENKLNPQWRVAGYAENLGMAKTLIEAASIDPGALATHINTVDPSLTLKDFQEAARSNRLVQDFAMGLAEKYPHDASKMEFAASMTELVANKAGMLLSADLTDSEKLVQKVAEEMIGNKYTFLRFGRGWGEKGHQATTMIPTVITDISGTKEQRLDEVGIRKLNKYQASHTTPWVLEHFYKVEVPIGIENPIDRKTRKIIIDKKSAFYTQAAENGQWVDYQGKGLAFYYRLPNAPGGGNHRYLAHYKDKTGKIRPLVVPYLRSPGSELHNDFKSILEDEDSITKKATHVMEEQIVGGYHHGTSKKQVPRYD